MYIWTHKKLDIGVNGDQIVDVNLTTGRRQELKPGAHISFTYQVTWKNSKISYAKRYDKYLDPTFFQHRVCLLSESRVDATVVGSPPHRSSPNRFTGSPSSTPS